MTPHDFARPDPHRAALVLTAGEPLPTARAALLLVHGRGASAEDILTLGAEVAPSPLALLAPQAVGDSWYPYRFLAPIERNEPHLSSALALLDRIVRQVEAGGIGRERIALLGFSQGACLALEYAARHAARYGAVIGFSGGLIGPPGTVFRYRGSLAGTPVFLGGSDVDAHIPKGRAEETAAALAALGAAVDLRLYPGMGHTVNRDEIEAARRLLAAIAAPAAP